MSRIDELPADQRAALSLLLRRQKTYAEVAGMLGIEERAVHDRAHAAVAVLAPGPARELNAAQRGEITDYLLGQQPAAGERLRTRTLLTASAPANAWATALVQELAGIDDATTAEIPPLVDAQMQRAPEPAPRPAPQTGPTAASASAPAPAAPAASPPSSRRGGAILLAVIAAAVVVAVILILSGGSSSKKTGGRTSSSSASSRSAAGPKVEGRITLTAPAGSASKGTIEILSEGTQRAFYIQAEHLPATENHFFYAVWLYNSPSSALALSKSPPVGSSHRIVGAAPLPGNAGSYKEILLTRETSTRPTHPGQVVLRGKLGPAA